MPPVPQIPDTAPFSPEQRAWLNGFFAGMFSRADVAAKPGASAIALTPLTILFGSQTGSAEGLAKKAAKEAGRRNFAATVLDMAQTDLSQLAGEKNVLVITSTYGDGEPPDNAKALHAALMAPATGASLSSVRFSVCGLGDTNYAKFNQCAKDFDAQFAKLGATRIQPRVECDLDFESPFATWLNTSLSALSAAAGIAKEPHLEVVSGPTSLLSTDEKEGYSKSNPFPALLLNSRNLNASGSAKQVHHVEFDLTGSGLEYEVGDALGVYAHNCPELVT
ncbi:MAG: flavodoxin domain-containing protein, partial [Opitutus sp.]